MPKKNKNEKTLFSEAFPPDKYGQRKKISVFSSNHELLNGIEIKTDDIIYKPLSKTDIGQIKKLHKEWFPVEYDHHYFRKILINRRGNYFTIGAFYNIKNDNKNENKEVLIGLAMCEYRPVSDYFIKHTSPEAIEEICKNIDFNEEVQAYLKCEDYSCVYIMTIGVIDEYRKLNIGSTLIKQIINTCLWDNLCVGVYLDVIYYNESAIKFYEKNNFKNVATIKNYYELKGNHYDSEVFLKIFTRKEKDEFRSKNYSILRKIINLLIITPMNVVYKIIFFILFFQCFRSKIKTQ